MSEERSERIHDLVAEYLDRLNLGESLDPFVILSEHPEDGPDVLEKLETFVDVTSHAAQDQPLGTLGDYTLRRQIGRGGMGVVYEAWENSMDRAVALKVLPAGIAADERAVARFIREAQLAGRLNHANVVSVHGMGVNEQTPYYSMEYVEGETLAQILAQIKDAEPETDTPFGSRDEVSYFGNLAKAFADAADGLQHAHSKGVVHRDIKPSNLILDSEGKLRILDFGLARLEGQESLTLSGDLMGTVLYMSPEQAMAKRIPLDHRTDVYSLGVTMYEVLTGQAPFKGKDQHDTLSQIIVRDPRSPRQLNSRVPKDLETIVLKCLRKDPGNRYGTAEALSQDLRRFVRGDPVEARPESAVEQFTRKALRYRGRLAAAAMVFLLCIACGVLAYNLWDTRQAENRREGEIIVQQHTLLRSRIGDPIDVPWKGGVQPLSSIFSASTTVDGLTIYFDKLDRPPLNIWRAYRTAVGEPFGDAELVPAPVSSDGWEAYPRISPDGQWLYFSRRGATDYDLCAARSTAPGDPEAPFRHVVRLNDLNTRDQEFGCCVSYDGKEIYFVSRSNLWVASFDELGNPEAGFHDPRPLETLNTAAQALPPSISRDGTMLFFSNRPADLPGGKPPRPGGQGRTDIWVSLRRRLTDDTFGPWTRPQNLGPPNTPSNEVSPWISADGNYLLYSKGPVWHDFTLREVPLVGPACGKRPLVAARSVSTRETVGVHHEERPLWVPGEIYRVSIGLTAVREASETCTAATEVVIEETVPAGWEPRAPSACGEVSDERTITWRRRVGECGAASFPANLTYDVKAGSNDGLVKFRGTIQEPRSPKFLVEGTDQLVSSAGFSGDGFIRRWLLLGPYRQPSNGRQDDGAPGEDAIRVDYLADRGGTREATVRPKAGQQIATDYSGAAASSGLAVAAADLAVNPGGVPTWHEWLAEDDTVLFDEYYGRNDGVVMYAVVYLQVDADINVRLGLTSDDAAQVLLDGEEISIIPVTGNLMKKGEIEHVVGCREEGRCPLEPLARGPHCLMLKVFEGRGSHLFRVRFQDPVTGEPLTEGDGIRVCLDPRECGFPPDE